MVPFEFVQPGTLDGVFEVIEDEGVDARLIAGGTAVVQFLKRGLLQPDVLCSLRRIEELHGIQQTNGALRIGAMTTHRQLEYAPEVLAAAPMLQAAEHSVADLRIRTMATLGGNLCHADPNEDPPVALLALDAKLNLASRKGRRTVAAADFFVDYYESALAPGEVLVSIDVPGRGDAPSWAFTKFAPRTQDDFATVTCAVSFQNEGGRMQGVRVALGCVGSVPMRLAEIEEKLTGERPAAALFEKVSKEAPRLVDPSADVRGSVAYKKAMSQVILCRTLEKTLAS